MKSTKTILGKNIRELIEFRHLKNKTELAKRVGANHKTIYDIYDDKANPKIETLDALAKTLSVPTWFLIQDTFAIGGTDLKKLQVLLNLVSTLSTSELDELIENASRTSDLHKIKESLSQYEPNNPLLVET